MVEKEVLHKNAEDLITLFQKVLKGYKLYNPGNPVFKKFAAAFYERVSMFHQDMEKVSFNIVRDGFIFMDENVKSSDTEEITHLLYNDGIRELSFKKGITEDEISCFFKILAKVTMFSSEDYDIVTLLWNGDFKFISYVTEEELVKSRPFDHTEFEQISISGSPLFATLFDPGRIANEKEETYSDKVRYELPGNISKSFCERLENYKDDQISVRFLRYLANKLFTVTDENIKKDLFKTTSVLWERLVRLGALKEGVMFLKLLVTISERMKDVDPVYCEILQKGISRLNPQLRNDILKDADGLESANYEHFGELMSMFDQEELVDTVVKVSGLDTEELKQVTFEKIAEGIKTVEPLKALVQHSDWKVVKNTLTILKSTSHPERIPIIRTVINNQNKEIRSEAFSVLCDVSADDALPVLERSISSPDANIRVSSVGKLITIKDPRAKNLLSRVFSEQNISKLPIEEISGYFASIVECEREDMYDLVAVMMMSSNTGISDAAFKELSKAKSFGTISRQLSRMIRSDDFLKLNPNHLSALLSMITPDTFEETLPALERIFGLKGSFFSKDSYKDIKTAVFSHVAKYGQNLKAKNWIEKAKISKDGELLKIIEQQGRAS